MIVNPSQTIQTFPVLAFQIKRHLNNDLKVTAREYKSGKPCVDSSRNGFRTCSLLSQFNNNIGKRLCEPVASMHAARSCYSSSDMR